LHSSTTTKNKSNRDMIGCVMFTFAFNDLDRSYLPPTGFAAASTDVLAFSVACTDALEMEIVCCSIASWIAT